MIETQPDSDLSRFLVQLFQEGAVRVRSNGEPIVDAAVRGLLLNRSHTASQALAYSAPDYLPSAAEWSAIVFYGACQLAVCRDMGESDIRRILESPCPKPINANTHWSVDLLFRHLPELFRIARHQSPGDPLLAAFRKLAAQWPLSSIGLDDLGELELSSILNHPALKQLYVDRVLEREDLSRLADPNVEEGVRTALGAQPNLCPKISRHLELLP